MIERFTILGGSSVYIPELLVSLLARNVVIDELVLYGRPGKKLQLVSQFCQRIVDRRGYMTRVIPSTDLEEAVRGAKYVLNHVRVGGMEARMRDEMIPPKFGLVGDEALGAGGIANAIRTLPVVFHFVEVLERVNPNALFINLTHPMSIIMEALIRYSSLRAVGITHLPSVYQKSLAHLLGVDNHRVTLEYFGAGNLGWISDVKVDNKSRLSTVIDLIEEQGHEDFDKEVVSLFRLIPVRNTGLFFYRHDVLKKQVAGMRFRSEILYENERRLLHLYENPKLDDIPEAARERNTEWYEETIVPLLRAMECSAECQVVLCQKNEDSIRDLPQECSVEVLSTVNCKKWTPKKVGCLPRPLIGLYVSLKESERLIIEAVRQKSFATALKALAVNPFVTSLEAAKRFLEKVQREEKVDLY
jgi:6-phospho-beta-glucosidase